MWVVAIELFNGIDRILNNLMFIMVIILDKCSFIDDGILEPGLL
jgi:hypothetical protein